ncbi:hypothetical protein TcWFU_003253 [Taenia crassiceps]|uniref:C2H2-type domain-containing protein n=1 Tax=Taenia crassiceps TaxID=6207 RepID=A0ABR4QGN2_9CEST
MGGSGRPKGGKVPLRCGRCHRVFDDMKAIILHAQQEHRVSQMPYPCPHCGIVGYYREKLLKRHLRIRCLGRGGEDRLEASGDTGSKLGTNSPQDECPRGTPVQSERQSSKTISSFGPLSNEKVRRNSPKSAPASEDQTPHLHRLRRSSLRSAQLEILTNDQPGVPEDLSPKPFSKEENFADPPSEVSSSHESLPISVRMSTRMRTMSSSEQKRTKEAENCNLVSPGQLSTRMLKGGVKHSPKAGRKNTSNNVISSRNRSSATPVEMKKKSLSHKIPNLDSLRNLKKSRLIAIKTCGPAICPSGNACASVELTTGPRFSSPMNSPQKTGKLHASSVKSALQLIMDL